MKTWNCLVPPDTQFVPSFDPLRLSEAPDVVIRSPQAFPRARETGASANSSISDRLPASDFASS